MIPITQASVSTGEELIKTGINIDKVRTQFGLTADEFKRVASVMLVGANKAKISLEDLGNSYDYVGSTAKAVNQSVETVTETGLKITRKGVKPIGSKKSIKENVFICMEQLLP